MYNFYSINVEIDVHTFSNVKKQKTPPTPTSIAIFVTPSYFNLLADSQGTRCHRAQHRSVCCAACTRCHPSNREDQRNGTCTPSRTGSGASGRNHVKLPEFPNATRATQLFELVCDPETVSNPPPNTRVGALVAPFLSPRHALTLSHAAPARLRYEPQQKLIRFVFLCSFSFSRLLSCAGLKAKTVALSPSTPLSRCPLTGGFLLACLPGSAEPIWGQTRFVILNRPTPPFLAGPLFLTPSVRRLAF